MCGGAIVEFSKSSGSLVLLFLVWLQLWCFALCRHDPRCLRRGPIFIKMWCCEWLPALALACGFGVCSCVYRWLSSLCVACWPLVLVLPLGLLVLILPCWFVCCSAFALRLLFLALRLLSALESGLGALDCFLLVLACRFGCWFCVRFGVFRGGGGFGWLVPGWSVGLLVGLLLVLVLSCCCVARFGFSL